MAKSSKRTRIRELAWEKVQYYTATIAMSAKASVREDSLHNGWWVEARVYVGASELEAYEEED